MLTSFYENVMKFTLPQKNALVIDISVSKTGYAIPLKIGPLKKSSEVLCSAKRVFVM